MWIGFSESETVTQLGPNHPRVKPAISFTNQKIDSWFETRRLIQLIFSQKLTGWLVCGLKIVSFMVK